MGSLMISASLHAMNIPNNNANQNCLTLSINCTNCTNDDDAEKQPLYTSKKKTNIYASTCVDLGKCACWVACCPVLFFKKYDCSKRITDCCNNCRESCLSCPQECWNKV